MAAIMNEMTRHLISSIFAVLSAVVLIGCGKIPSPAASADPVASPKQSAASVQGDAEKVLRLFCWSAYVPQAIVDQFTKETGITVFMETYASNEEMLAKLMTGAGSYDLIQPGECVIEDLIKDGLLLPINHAAIPNLKNLAPEFTDMPFDPGNRFSVPCMAGSAGIVVNRLCIPKTARHPKNAGLFMNFILRPDVSAEISNVFPCLNPNAAVRALLTGEQRSNPAGFPTAEELGKMPAFRSSGNQAGKVDEIVRPLKAQ